MPAPNPTLRATRPGPVLHWIRVLRLWLAIVGLLAPAARAQAPAAVHTVRVGEPATLTVWNRPVLTLRAKVDEIDPETRVANAQKRLEDLPLEALRGTVAFAPGQLNELTGLFLTVDSRMIVGLLPQDVDPESGKTLQQYADEAAERLRAALRAQVELRTLPAILRAVGLSIAATLAFAGAVWLAVRGRRKALARLQGRLAQRRWVLAGIDVAQYFFAIQRGLARLTALGVVVIAAYLWLTFVFVQFPYTEPWGQGLGDFLREELSLLGGLALGAVPKLFTVLVIFVLARLVARVVSSFFQRVEEGHVLVAWLEPESARATRRIVVALLWLFAIIVAYPYVPGSNSDAFKGVSVFAGLMITLGSSGLVNHVMSGFVLVYSRALKAGDFVRIGEVEGTVTVIGVLSTKIVTRKREEVTIPNAVVVGDRVTNYSRLGGQEGAIVSTTVTIGYDTPWRQVHELLLLGASKTAGVRKAPAPFVLQRALSDFYVEYELRVHLDLAERRVEVLSELHAHVQDAFNEFGVQIMSPHFVAQPSDKVYVPKEHWRDPPARDDGSAAAGPAKSAR